MQPVYHHFAYTVCVRLATGVIPAGHLAPGLHEVGVGACPKQLTSFPGVILTDRG